MIFETTVEKLLNVVENANRVTLKNSTLPALNTILILVSGKSVKVRATNLSLGVEFEALVKSEKEGVVALDGKILAEFLGTLPKNSKVNIKEEGNVLIVSSGTSKTSIKTHPYEDFPTLPSVSGISVTIPKKEFIRGVKMTAFAAAQSDIKPEISSIYIAGEKNTLLFVSTDSFRLSEKKELMHKQTEFPPVLVPYKNMIEIARVIENIESDIILHVGENQIAFTAENVFLTSRIVSGAFPDYKQIIPKGFLTEAVVLKQDLLNTLKAANIFSDKFNQITFNIFPSKKKIECTSRNSDVGDYSGVINATLTGDDVTISINQRYFMEVLSLIPQDSISMGLNGGNKAIVVRGASDVSFTYLLMPMNR